MLQRLFFCCSVIGFVPVIKSFSPTLHAIRRPERQHEAVTLFATLETTDTTAQRRVLGSQENLMLPRQYGPNSEETFPQMNHVSCAILSATPAEQDLLAAVDEIMRAHPLLRCSIDGDGEPSERIDMFQMVRKGDPNPCTFVSNRGAFSSNDVVRVINIDGDDRSDLDSSWQAAFKRDLDDGSWCHAETSPLWKLELHKLKGSENGRGPSALLFSFNHAISDQSSACKLIDQLISLIKDIEEEGSVRNPPKQQDIPLSVEESVLGEGQSFHDIQLGGFSLDTAKYIAGKAFEEVKKPVILPDGFNQGNGILGALTTISGNAAGGNDINSSDRKSVVEFQSLSRTTTEDLLLACRANGVSVSNALAAALALTSSDFVDGGKQVGMERNYKVLQSLDMRRFGAALDQGSSVGCLAGSMDLMLGPLPDRGGSKLRMNPTRRSLAEFWDLARESRSQTEQFIESDGPRHAVRVFDFAMSISDMNNLVHLSAQSKDTQGRAYSAGFTNAGVYERLAAYERVKDTGNHFLKQRRGRYEIEDIFFAASNARSGTLYRCSCMTVNSEMKFTFHPASPIVTKETNRQFALAVISLLETVATANERATPERLMDNTPRGAATKVAACVGALSLIPHIGGFISFAGSVFRMKESVPAADFWPALNFWIFFAVSHPVLQPILWISDVLHASPGPMVAGLVPISFLVANVVAIAVVSFSSEVRNVLNTAALFAFLSYVGAGLDGTAGLGDFNLALDDSYKGQVVKGCPAYEDVRQPSMDGFDLNKYQGLWYEQKFHDYTQFKEVYDTTLDIKLTTDGNGWVDDFAVKGPSPDAAPLSWDKSPVANGAHYFLFGRVDKNDPPGILRESGFGVEFPNYIVDVQKNGKGEYTEAIQFQCLERGGVRVFEGINFMSRNPVMSDTEMSAMHRRAEEAGMFPYGASPEQMHTVARRSPDSPKITNNWQAMWRAIGVDKLLELLAESIEDGGR